MTHKINCLKIFHWKAFVRPVSTGAMQVVNPSPNHGRKEGWGGNLWGSWVKTVSPSLKMPVFAARRQSQIKKAPGTYADQFPSVSIL